jgi:hypothetical protein
VGSDWQLDPSCAVRSIYGELFPLLAIGAAGDPAAVQTARKVISLLLRDHGIDLRDILCGETSA